MGISKSLLRHLLGERAFLRVRDAYHLVRGSHLAVSLDYPLRSPPRWGYGRPPHDLLQRIFEADRKNYSETLRSFEKFRDRFAAIEASADSSSLEPTWDNTWFPPIDAIALYGFLAVGNPLRYVEIGSGHSTRFARRAISDQGLQTRIISIDPEPRVEVNTLCDEVVRDRVETVDVAFFLDLEAGDILFIDGSHRVLMNSDVTMLLLDVLPRLREGVIVHIHDIFLPEDYPPEWSDRYYSEHYLLAALLLGRGTFLRILLPVAFVMQDPGLRELANSLTDPTPATDRTSRPTSFWVRIVQDR